MDIQQRQYLQRSGVGQKFTNAITDENLIEAKSTARRGLNQRAAEIISEGARGAISRSALRERNRRSTGRFGGSRRSSRMSEGPRSPWRHQLFGNGPATRPGMPGSSGYGRMAGGGPQVRPFPNIRSFPNKPQGGLGLPNGMNPPPIGGGFGSRPSLRPSYRPKPRVIVDGEDDMVGDGGYNFRGNMRERRGGGSGNFGRPFPTPSTQSWKPTLGGPFRPPVPVNPYSAPRPNGPRTGGYNYPGHGMPSR